MLNPSSLPLDLHNAAVTGGKLDPHTRELAILVACREIWAC